MKRGRKAKQAKPKTQSEAEDSKKSQHDIATLPARLEEDLTKIGIKIVAEVRKFIEKMDFSKEILVKLTQKSKKVDTFTSAIVFALLREKSETLTVRFDIRSALPQLKLPANVDEYVKGITFLNKVQICEEVENIEAKPELNRFVERFFMTVVGPSLHNLRKLEIISNNDSTTLEILERLQECQLASLSIVICQDFGRFNAAIRGLKLETLKTLRIGSNIPSLQTNPLIGEFFKTIELMKNLERLQVFYRCAGFQEQVVDSILKLPNIQEIIFENDFHLTLEQAKSIYASNIFLCSFNIQNRAFFNTLDSAVRSIIHLFAVRKFNFNRIVDLIGIFQNSTISERIREDNLMDISEYFKIIVI